MTTTAELAGYVQRRRLLTGLGTGFVAWTAGCVSTTDTTNDTTNHTPANDTTNHTLANGTPTDTSTNGETTQTEPSQPIHIVCRSRNSTSRTVTLELSTDTAQIQRTTFQLDPDAEKTISTPITEPGRYELTVSVAVGPTSTRPFAIDDYDLRAGSDLIVEISGSDIIVVLQE
jgi:hypothetical protein